MRSGVAAALLAIACCAGAGSPAGAQSPAGAGARIAASAAGAPPPALQAPQPPLTLTQAIAAARTTHPPPHPSLGPLFASAPAPASRPNPQATARIVALEQSALRLALADAAATRRIQVMQQFFAALSADRGYAMASERMSLAYGAFLNASRRAERDAAAALEAAELDARYRDRLRVRSEQAMAQRLARIALALALERPDAPPSELAEPELPAGQLAVPAYADAWPLVEQRHPRLAALRALREASVLRTGRGADRVAGCPAIDADRVPARAAEAARCDRIGQALDEATRETRLELQSTLLSIEHLQGPARDAATRESAFRELALDRARELNVQGQASHLGEAMTASLEAADRERRVDYDLALALARLDLLLGHQP